VFHLLLYTNGIPLELDIRNTSGSYNLAVKVEQKEKKSNDACFPIHHFTYVIVCDYWNKGSNCCPSLSLLLIKQAE